jgi:histidinol phosphatase-like PHP family hydrolase
VLLSIDPDAHSTGELAHTAYGVGVARKGWASKGAVLNAKGPEQLTAWLEERRGSPIPERAGLASG